MEARKKKPFKFPDKMFETDPVTGKRIALPYVQDDTEPQNEISKVTNLPTATKPPLEPLNFKDLFSDKSKKSDQKSLTKRRMESLDLGNCKILDSSEKSTKIRKLDAPHSARRLFASKKHKNLRASNTRESTSKTILPKTKKSIVSSKSSPLLNMEEVERNLYKDPSTLKKFSFSSSDLPIFKYNLTSSQKKSKKLEIPVVIMEENETFLDKLDNETMEEEVQSKTPDSIHEFHKLEQLCKDSPITSVCNLMQDTMINSIKRTKFNLGTDTEFLKQIETLMKEEKARHIKLMKEEEIRHQNTLSLLNSLLEKLMESENIEKENRTSNIFRRSERLSKMSPLVKSKLITSPAIHKSGDLLKSTLKKNLTSNYSICSPQAKKPISPKSLNTFAETPRSDRKYLSARLQDQYLLLQDTPVHK